MLFQVQNKGETMNRYVRIYKRYHQPADPVISPPPKDLLAKHGQSDYLQPIINKTETPGTLS